ncbi:YeeE/YedE family protein [Paralimibaculum aggregatum]|uniref:YeeE/YedE family protein n=1 Tax=Paralimibaculum aggregatum TaxID=3036245 RepID=A0ABQ6LCB8_9RHOB|nr:YeeE/YedE family protein [Limibaculum sp. NKW23]GMG81030.1 YeeE/YedE family protein [Limibaculum sp. NKW23]
MSGVLLVALCLAAYLAQGGAAGLRYAAGAALGGAAGFALYHAAFGFTAAWRRMVRERRGAGLRAQMLLIGLTCLVTYPLIGFEAETGWNMHPVVLPMSLASAVGAFMFGAGMQLGGGCASGTLFTVGGGSTRMLVTLIAFIAGSVWATAHLHEFWFPLGPSLGLPAIPGTSVISLFGPFGALAALGLLLAAIWLGSAAVERRAHGSLEPLRPQGSWLRGPWALWAGALGLAAVGIGCFLLFQRPWGVTAGFALWGAKALEAVGVELRDWGYWSGWRAGQLDHSLLADRTSVMNFGIVLGAMAASALAGRFAPVLKLSPRDVATAVIGGLMMGYGARLAFGCNIGAYLGGLVSGSMHGLWWLLWGFAGSWLGTWLRAVIAMDPPWPQRGAPA